MSSRFEKVRRFDVLMPEIGEMFERNNTNDVYTAAQAGYQGKGTIVLKERCMFHAPLREGLRQVLKI
jgi:hypothetical protein